MKTLEITEIILLVSMVVLAIVTVEAKKLRRSVIYMGRLFTAVLICIPARRRAGCGHCRSIYRLYHLGGAVLDCA